MVLFVTDYKLEDLTMLQEKLAAAASSIAWVSFLLLFYIACAQTTFSVSVEVVQVAGIWNKQCCIPAREWCAAVSPERTSENQSSLDFIRNLSCWINLLYPSKAIDPSSHNNRQRS